MASFSVNYSFAFHNFAQSVMEKRRSIARKRQIVKKLKINAFSYPYKVVVLNNFFTL